MAASRASRRPRVRPFWASSWRQNQTWELTRTTTSTPAGIPTNQGPDRVVTQCVADVPPLSQPAMATKTARANKAALRASVFGPTRVLRTWPKQWHSGAAPRAMAKAMAAMKATRRAAAPMAA